MQSQWQLSSGARLGGAGGGISAGCHQEKNAEPWASQELCERRLAMTDWNRRNDLNEIVKRRHTAPLSGQSNNAQQLAKLQQELTGLSKRMDVTGAGRKLLGWSHRPRKGIGHHGKLAGGPNRVRGWRAASARLDACPFGFGCRACQPRPARCRPTRIRAGSATGTRQPAGARIIKSNPFVADKWVAS